MKKIISIIVSLIILIIVFNPGAKVLAKEGQCHLDWCLVPAPTVITPTINQTTSSRPDITGLTWKTAVVQVFIDGVEITNIKQIKHADYYGSFWARPNFDLKPGKHYVYTIAHSENPGWFDQSKESKYVYFEVVASKKQLTSNNSQKISNNQVPSNQTIDKNNSGTSTVSVLNNNSEQPVAVEPSNPRDQKFSVTPGKIAGGVSVEGRRETMPPLKTDDDQKFVNNIQKTADFNDLSELLQGELSKQHYQDTLHRNRIIGLGILVIVLVMVVVSFGFKGKQYPKKFVKPEASVVPPPPQPPEVNQFAANQVLLNDKEKSLERDYWATPEDSMFTPYDNPKIDNLDDFIKKD